MFAPGPKRRRDDTDQGEVKYREHLLALGRESFARVFPSSLNKCETTHVKASSQTEREEVAGGKENE